MSKIMLRQELTAYGCEKLYYWSSKSTAEVDFLISKNNLVFPIEVKNGYSRKGKSLSVYKNKFHPTNVFRISPRNFTQDNQFKNIPLYSVSKILT